MSNYNIIEQMIIDVDAAFKCLENDDAGTERIRQAFKVLEDFLQTELVIAEEELEETSNDEHRTY